MKTLVNFFATLIVSCMVFMAVAQSSMDYTIMVEDIEFQPGVTIDINVNVYVNENANEWADHGKIFAIEGMAHTANCWKPFAEELFLNGPESVHLNEFYAIDMPGRGGSGLPEYSDPDDPFLLDQMYIEDYLVVIEGVLSYLNDFVNVHPTTIMGHSLGGLEVIMLQDKLVKRGTNLRAGFGIKNAILLAPAPPAPIDWAFISGPGGSALLGFVNYIPGRGTMLDLVTPPNCYSWPYIFFTNTCCYAPPLMVEGAPTVPQVLSNGYNAMEPGPLCLQIAGMQIPEGMPYPYKPRVEAAPEIFKPKHGVQLTIFADEFDKMMNPGEEWNVYTYLTGDTEGKNYLLVEGTETCHDTHISDPNALVELLDMPYYFKNSIAEEQQALEVDFMVYPNPSNGTTSISYYLPDDVQVSLKIYNTLGQEMVILEKGIKPSGIYLENFDLGALPKGVYMVKLIAGSLNQTTTIIKE